MTLRWYSGLCLLLFFFLPGLAQESSTLSPREQLDRPFISLFELPDSLYVRHDAKSLRSALEHEQKTQISECEDQEKRLRAEIDSHRDGLKKLNDSAPRDDAMAAAERRQRHAEISALEQALRVKKDECEHGIPARFEIARAKATLLDQWPSRRQQTTRKIEHGRARERKHGDVDDIGYRKLVENQDKDIPLDEQAVHQMTSSKRMPPEIPYPAVRQYVQELAERIARSSDLKIPLQVTVLDSTEISSIGLPGGYLFLTSGLITSCETESQLAGVMAQQIAHIAARHSTRTSKGSVITRMLVPATEIATGLFTGGVSNAGVYYGMGYGFQGLGALVDRTLVGASAKAQKEADQLGIQYAWNAGFDPKGFIGFLDAVANLKASSKTDSLFVTKPLLGQRLLDAFTELQYLPSRQDVVVDSEEFHKAKERLRR